jgi:hypothetical protein
MRVLLHEVERSAGIKSPVIERTAANDTADDTLTLCLERSQVRK